MRASGALDLREVAARTTLREVRQKGHAYVDLRRVGKRTIFFCTLCLTPCYSDGVLFDHLRGNLHARRYAAAKATLFGPDPWPFGDGVLFFNPSCVKEQSASLVVRNGGFGNVANGDEVDEVTSRFRVHGNGSLCDHHGDNCNGADDANHGIVANGHKRSSECNGNPGKAVNGHCKTSKCNGADNCLTIHRVLIKEQVKNLSVDLMGLGHIASRIHETDEVRSKISRIWCAWLGQVDSDDGENLLASPKCDFAIVSFTYTYDLGRKGALDHINSPRSEGSCFGIDYNGSPRKKRKKSFSDPEDSPDNLTIRCGSSVEECPGLNGGSDDASRQLQTSRLTTSKAFRRELRKRERLAAEKTCDICGQLMLPGKDVGTLLNCKTGNLACSSRNTNGAFHLFHVSCLVHWILLCEFEIRTDQLSNVKPTRGRKGRAALNKRISSVFCPECQGTGKYIDGDELEKPTVLLSEMFLYKLKAIEAHKAWMKNPEVLQKCSTGLHFPSDSEEKFQEKVTPVKLLRFYQADA